MSFVPVFLRSGGNYDMFEASKETALECLDESLAIQSQKEEADINTIVRRFGLTGQLPADVRMPVSGDFTGVLDYRSMLHVVMQADASFEAMDAFVRNRFNNDPAAFVDFCLDPSNRAEAERLGLVDPAKMKPAVKPVAGVSSPVASPSST